MAKEKAIYAPGELTKVKERLGPIDENEARRLQKILGGEVGDERWEEPEHEAYPYTRKRKNVARAVETTDNTFEKQDAPPKKLHFTLTPPGYFERVKMDVCCGQSEFGIKTAFQVFFSRLCFFSPPKRDKVSAYFVRTLLSDCYKHLSTLVNSTRILFPRNNSDRNVKVKKMSAFTYRTLDVLRRWNITAIFENMERLQRRPRNVLIEEFSEIVKEIYKPLFYLEDLNLTHIESAFDTLYKVLFLDKPTNETEQLRGKISETITSYQYVKSNIRRFFYPLLMKMSSDRYYPYEIFFEQNKENILAFLGVTEAEKIKVPIPRGSLTSSGAEDNGAESSAPESDAQGDAASDAAENEGEDFLLESEKAELERQQEEKREAAKQAAAEKKVVDKGIGTLMRLFPYSGLDSALGYGNSEKSDETDLYPYFAEALDLKKGSELISPCDPAQAALVLTHTIKELTPGFRTIKFKFSSGDGTGTPAEEDKLTPILEGWHNMLEDNFYNNYVPKIDEYARIAQQEGAPSNYSMNLLNDIHWVRRYFLFPYYDYRSGIPPSFSRKNTTPLYSAARRLRVALTNLAADIEEAVQSGKMQAAGTECTHIKNAWAGYSFEIENPVSKRLHYLFNKDKRTNVSLIYVTLAICTVLDSFLNNPESPAYTANQSMIFRSVNNKGKTPVLWVDKRTDTFDIFTQSLISRRKSG